VAWPAVAACIGAVVIVSVEVGVAVGSGYRSYMASLDAQREYRFIKDNFPWGGIQCPSGGSPQGRE
jgi:hypothetical protein